VCITNDGFYEDKAGVMVGYATAVDGLYSGSMRKDDIMIDSIAANVALIRTSEKTAQFHYAKGGISSDVAVEYLSEKLQVSGTSEGVEVTGTVTLDGLGSFEIVVEDLSGNITTYSFFGTINRPF
jgi:hypothetical protein